MRDNLVRRSDCTLILITLTGALLLASMAVSLYASPSGTWSSAAIAGDGNPRIATLTFDPTSVRLGSSFSATFSGANLNDGIFFDVRYRSPGSDTDRVVLNWQQGESVVRRVALDTTPGTWTITGARAHQDINDHSATFISVSASVTVNPSVVTELHFDPESVETDGASTAFTPFTATFSGSNLTDETYFDVRYRVPCSDRDQVVWNWQRGTAAARSPTADTAPGVWMVTGAWAHQDVNDHSADFAPLSTTLLVRQARAPLIGGPVTSIAIDPTKPATVYAASSISGIYKTYDGGQTWMIANSGLSSENVLTLAIDPTNPCVIYAGTPTGVFKSIDGAAKWTAARAGLPNAAIRALAIDPHAPATLYAGTDDNSVFKSLDGGLSWDAEGLGLPPATTIQSLAVDPVNSAMVYAGTHALYPALAQIFKSTDGGGHWDRIFVRAETVSALVVDPKNPSVIYAGTVNPDRGNYNEAGVFKSADGGQFWYGLWSGSGANYELAQPGHRYIESLAIDPVNSAVLYAGGKYAVLFKSTNAGASWTRSGVGDLSNGDIQALAIDPSKPSTIYAGAKEGIFKSTDAGATWKQVP